ncbi:unnamed protein product, partial [Prunus brigantina]
KREATQYGNNRTKNQYLYFQVAKQSSKNASFLMLPCTFFSSFLFFPCLCLVFFSTVVTVRSYLLVIKHSTKLYSRIKETFTFVIKSLVQINLCLCFASAFVQGFLFLNYH